MYFNLKGLLRFTGRMLSQICQNRCKRPLRRVAILLAFFLLYPLLELVVWLGLWLDELLFRGYQRLPVEAAVFIVGNPRSGTTFLHRLLARDRGRFSTMQMWEILFAPSVSQRKMVAVLAALDRRLGSPLQQGLDVVERRWQKQNVMHRVSLRMPEEDDYLLLHIWSALTAGLSAGLLDEARPYTYFDTALPERERTRIMAFYKACVQRHLYAHHSANGTHYLAKNPALCPKLGTVLEQFADAKIIYLVRNPLEMIPSYVSMMDFSWETVGVPEGNNGLHDYILDMAQHWYHYPLQRLEQIPQPQYIVVRYDDLVADPEGTVAEIYRHFGFEMSPAFAEALRQETKKAEHYHSRHHYSLEKAGLTRQQIVDRCGDILERFGFGKGRKLRRPTWAGCRPRRSSEAGAL
jgi:hypothetical protein